MYSWFEEACLRETSGRDGVYLCMSNVDRLFCEGKFEEVDRLLTIDPKNLPTDIIITLLVTANWAKDKLPSRMEFVLKAKEKFIRKLGDKQAYGLYSGLE